MRKSGRARTGPLPGRRTEIYRTFLMRENHGRRVWLGTKKKRVSMSLPIVLLVLAASAVLAIVVLIPVLRVYRGTRLVACPETKQPAAVELDSIRAGLPPPGAGSPRLRPPNCPPWP